MGLIYAPDAQALSLPQPTRPLRSLAATDHRIHAARRVTLGAWSALVDLAIADLVEDLWTLGIETHNSCENHQGTGCVFIGFASLADAEGFLRAVLSAQEGEAEFRKRVLSNAPGINGSRDLALWHHVLSITPGTTGKEGARYCIGIRFPQSDLPRVKEIFEALRAAAQDQEKRST